MSLDITLTENGAEVFDSNITHNLTAMADAAGIYKAIWRPEEIGFTKAAQLYPLLQEGLSAMVLNPEKFETLNPPNGWGTYDCFVPWIFELMQACRKYPKAEISVCR